ncbi:MAG TPA: sialidase family protein, partial [Anaerolineales bacterium]|nr:sialidase family protein [Anaerolineales bacterium]
MQAQPLNFRKQRRFKITFSIMLVASLALATAAYAGHATGGTDVKITNDNNNVDGGIPNPSFDAQNRQSNETTVAISPFNPNILAAGANDYRMVPVTGDGWLGFYVSDDGGATWFNTMVPGFPSDTSPAGLTSPLLGLDGSGDPVVRFDASGDLYVGGIAFNRDFDQQDLNNDTVVYVAKYDYTPGSPGGTSTPNSAANPPNFTYAFTTIVDRGAVGFAIPPGQRFGIAGIFDDKNWMATDNFSGSPCYGNVYYSYTKFTGVGGGFPIMFSSSTNGGVSFSEPRSISQKGQDGTHSTQGSNIAVAPNGRVYVVFRTFPTNADPTFKVQVVRSDDCGKHFGKPVTATLFTPMPRQAAGLTFRTPTETWIAADDTNSNVVYVAYMAMAGTPSNADIFVARSTNGGATWGAPVKVNDDITSKHQFWPAITVSNGDLHVVWYDFRNSPNPGGPSTTNDVLNVYYASSNTTDAAYPTFSHNVQVSDVGHQPNCLMFGGGTSGFHGDYIDIAAYFDSVAGVHKVFTAWTDNRDVPEGQCDIDPAAPNFGTNNIGNRNQSIYGDVLTVSP